MAPEPSLHKARSGVPLVPVAIVASATLLGFGLILPVLETQKLALRVESYSVVGGIRDLADAGHLSLALLVLAFSVVFPVLKLGGLAMVWFVRMDPRDRLRTLDWLDFLGKWSLLDVFAVVILLGTVNLGFPSGAEALSGVYVFEAAILLTMLSTRLGVHVARRASPPPPRELPVPGGMARAWSAALGLAGLLLYGLGLWRPLIRTQKWHFWESDFSILNGTFELFHDAPVLAVTLLVLVVALPLGRGAWMLWTVLRGSAARVPPGRWCMGDVFLLAVLVVGTKLGDLVEVTYGPGVWLLVSGAVALLLQAWIRERA